MNRPTPIHPGTAGQDPTVPARGKGVVGAGRDADLEDREKQGGKSAPCTFGQRQGHIDIDLRNGDTYSLSPGNNANHYRDQKDNKVLRTRSIANSQEFRWENGKYVTVHFNASNHHSGGYNPGYGAGAYGNGGADGADGSYYINPLQNGGIEVVWSKHGCVATFTKQADSRGFDSHHPLHLDPKTWKGPSRPSVVHTRGLAASRVLTLA